MVKKRKLNKQKEEEHQPKKQKKIFNGINTDKSNNSITTPKWLIEWIQEFYKITFDFDPCPLDKIDTNGLEINSLLEEFDWGENNFVNPPYNSTKGQKNGIKHFILKALEEKRLKKKRSVFLIPFTNSEYFINLIFKNCSSYILLPSGLIKFIKNNHEYKHCFPKPLCIVDFGTEDEDKKLFRYKHIKITNNVEKTKTALYCYKNKIN